MGQGRNTICLAERGWNSVKFDPADRAVEAAKAQANKRGVRITATVHRDSEFDWSEAQWDLIVLSYVGGREYAALVQRGLRPGGMVILEAFHRDATKNSSIGMLGLPFRAGLGPFRRFVAANNTMDEIHEARMPGPHWYLFGVAVDPELHGQGIGSAIIGEGRAVADREATPCYLETSQPCQGGRGGGMGLRMGVRLTGTARIRFSGAVAHSPRARV